METEINTKRFFNNEELEKEVNLTQEEGKLLIDFEMNEYFYSGLSGISGGFAIVILEGFDEEDDNILLGRIESGIQSDCENNVNICSIVFNREKKTITFA